MPDKLIDYLNEDTKLAFLFAQERQRRNRKTSYTCHPSCALTISNLVQDIDDTQAIISNLLLEVAQLKAER